MTQDEFDKLAPGDNIRHFEESHGYVVTANYGGRVTAVRSVDMTNPREWVIVQKAGFDGGESFGLEKAALALDAGAQELNVQRDPGMANHLRSWARKIRAIKP